MENKFEPHKSLLDLDANIVVLIAYIGCIILNFIPGIKFVAILVPIVIFFVEKDSKFVRFHAMQSILSIVTAIALTIILGILAGVFAGLAVFTSSLASASIAGIIGLLILLVSIIIVVLMIIASYKGWKYECYEIPVIGKYASKIVFK